MTVGEAVLRDKPGLLYENAYARAHAWWRWLSVQTGFLIPRHGSGGVGWEREGGGAHPRVVAGSSLLIHLVHLQLSSAGLHRGAIAGSQRQRTEQHGRRVVLQSIAAERHSA